MANLPILEAEARPGTGKGAARQARRDGYVPGVVYGGGKDPQSINVKFNVLLKELKAGKFLSKLINLRVGDEDTTVICRGVQRDVTRDMPTHVDFLRLSERSRINLHIPVEIINHEKCPGLRKGGVLTVVRPEVELKVNASAIPEKLVVDLEGRQLGDTVKISDIALPEGTRPMITDRDFVILNISTPKGLISDDDEDEGTEAETEVAEG
ncbi:50S ribosomal protein L25/general stress protein Ctc [Paralimibaculum aggregatum]|uniref:Large ribosomal subunit protein bL25 n=1 Tax=Paralimibaculum aggregatum TaxID=3036245 RepID=A0ABQ6LIG5_9RHOB|nr:50S ribosomal protein L25/general stress protein Ctc [Limibaculum sp. NKW23]GMG82226.1 50S ribosomal protein L25/general stress protein Ctc [Limibaculum sp. NKW23]